MIKIDSKDNNKQDTKGSSIVTIIIVIIFIIIGWNLFGNSTTSDKTSNKSNKPTNMDIMAYAQTVLDKELSNPSYSNKELDYNITETGLRYKIEGKVDNKKFYMIIEFSNDKYEDYELISLQVGSNYIYKK